MKTKAYLIILFMGMISVNSFSQLNIDYFGQTPPGDSAIVFSPDFISLSARLNSNGSFFPDGKEFCFTAGGWIMITTYDGSVWSTPDTANFLGDNLNYSTGGFYSPDSSRLYLHMGTTTEDKGIWYCERDGSTWSSPVRLPEVINTGAPGEPFVSYDNTVFMSKGDGINYSRLEDDEYKVLHNLGKPVNIGASEIDPFILPDESILIFGAEKSGGYGKTDLYISYKKTDGSWTSPKNLGPEINTADHEYGPSVTPDSNYFLFTRINDWNTSTASDIFWISTSFIERLKSVNADPYVLNEIPNQTGTLGNIYSYTIPDTIFFDDDGTETISLSASLSDGSDLPDSLGFDPVTNTISGRLKEAGTYNVKITATDTAGASTSDIYRLTVETSTGIHNNSVNTDGIIIYPNPVIHELNIEIKGLSAGNRMYELIDMFGRIVKKDQLQDSEINSIDVSQITYGTYMLKVFLDNEEFVRRVTVKQ